MSNEIKQGDKVRVSKEEARKYQKARRYVLENSTFKVKSIENDTAFITNGRDDIVISTKYLIKIGTEPTAPKIKVGDRVRNVKSDLCGIALKIEHGIVEVGIPYDKERHYWNTDIVELFEPTEQTEAEKKPNIGSITIPVEVDLTDSFWDSYTADLAKEIVLKTVNSASDRRPMAIAEYATDIAKAVVDGLKRK